MNALEERFVMIEASVIETGAFVQKGCYRQ